MKMSVTNVVNYIDMNRIYFIYFNMFL